MISTPSSFSLALIGYIVIGKLPGQSSLTATFARAGVLQSPLISLVPEEEASRPQPNWTCLLGDGSSNGPRFEAFLLDMKYISRTEVFFAFPTLNAILEFDILEL
jgi:hypothetical protein